MKKQPLDQRIEAALRAYPNKTNREIAKNIHGATSAAISVVRSLITGVAAPPRKSKRPNRTFAAFQAANDITQIITRKVAELLPPDGEEYFTDHEFREACEVGIGSWRRYADDDRFTPHRLVRGQHNYWAPKPMIQKMKLILGI